MNFMLIGSMKLILLFQKLKAKAESMLISEYNRLLASVKDKVCL